jgi:hypothetical protein
MKNNLYFFSLLFIFQFFLKNISLHATESTVIQIGKITSPLEMLAAKEVCRYVYLRTGTLLQILNDDKIDDSKCNIILIANKHRQILNIIQNEKLKTEINQLAEQQYIVSTTIGSKHKVLLICGGDDCGTLYGAYRFLEELGIHFYIHGDVIPDNKIILKFPNLDITGEPQFDLRGIMPFLDFPENKNWWSPDDYKAIIAQLPKMGMNFIGSPPYSLKTSYNWVKAKPIWGNNNKDFDTCNEKVKTICFDSLVNIKDRAWNINPQKTSDFSFGASEIFDTEYLSNDYKKSFSTYPSSDTENIYFLDNVNNILSKSYRFAKKLGMKSCSETEIPLTIPDNIKKYLKSKDIDPASDSAYKIVFKELYSLIKSPNPPDYFCLFTPEYLNYEEVSDTNISQTLRVLKIASETAESTNVPFKLAVDGWTIGSSKDPNEFDNKLPKHIPFISLNREQGFDPVDPEFLSIRERPKWAITWFEDNKALALPQLWVGRIRKDAADAYKYGCSGFIGIHWRTQILSPSFAAMAQAGWQFDLSKSGSASSRDFPTNDFYKEWAKVQFGKEVSGQLAKIFVKIDGGQLCTKDENKKEARLYRPIDWSGIRPDEIKSSLKHWNEIQKKFAFIDEFLALESKIKGIGNKERYNYWLNTFRFAQKMAQADSMLNELDSIMSSITNEKNKNIQEMLVNEKAIPLRSKIIQTWGEMMTLFLSTVSTISEIGTVADLELYNLNNISLFTKCDSSIIKITGQSLPEREYWKEYRGPSRLIVPTKRSIIEQDENLKIKVIVLSKNKVKDGFIFWKPLYGSTFNRQPLEHVSRSVYSATISGIDMNRADFEYYIKVNTEGETLVYPSTAPDINQTVVVW